MLTGSDHGRLRHRHVRIATKSIHPTDIYASSFDGRNATNLIQLQQVLINLVMNGIQAMASVADRARVLILRTQRHGDDQILVAVEDVGVGIEPENLGRLFNAFYTTKASGLGIGLSISRSIVEAHGGRVWAAPNAGPGMTFQFTLSADLGKTAAASPD